MRPVFLYVLPRWNFQKSIIIELRLLKCIVIGIRAVGDDELGREIINSVDHRGIENCIVVNAYPTGTVGVELKDGNSDYTIYENVAWDYIDLTFEAINSIEQADAICYGTLAQRSDLKIQIKATIWIISMALLMCYFPEVIVLPMFYLQKTYVLIFRPSLCL